MAVTIERLFGLAVGERSTAELREIDIQLTKEVHKLDRQYKAAYQHIVRLKHSYKSCRNQIVFERYGELKAMIKACCLERVLEDANETHSQSRNFAEAARQLRIRAEENACVMDEITYLSRTELKDDINMKKEKRKKIKSRLKKLRKRVQELQEQYEDSRQINPISRYRAMKTIIKSLIRDESLFDEFD